MSGTNSIPNNHAVNNPQISDNRIIKVISITTAVLVFLLALGSFALSYNALQGMATRNGITGWLSYIWPLLIDFALIVFSLSVVNSYLQSESTWKQWGLVGIYTLATIGFNVAHAPENLQAQIVAAIAPVSLFFSFELLMSQLRTSVQKFGITQGISQLSLQAKELDTEVSQKAQKVSSLDAQIDTLQAQVSELQKQRILAKNGVTSPNDTSLSKANDTRLAQIQERREQVLILTQEGMNQADIADELGVSIATIKRDTKALNGRMS